MIRKHSVIQTKPAYCVVGGILAASGDKMITTNTAFPITDDEGFASARKIASGDFDLTDCKIWLNWSGRCSGGELMEKIAKFLVEELESRPTPLAADICPHCDPTCFGICPDTSCERYTG